MKTINDIYDLADYINSCDEYPSNATAIIEANGWTDEQHNDFGVCSDGQNRVILDSNTAEAKVVSM